MFAVLILNADITKFAQEVGFNSTILVLLIFIENAVISHYSILGLVSENNL